MVLFPSKKAEVSLPEEHFLEDWFDWPFLNENRPHLMRTDIQENDTDYVLDIDLPGFEKSDLSLILDNGYLTVTAKHEKTNDEKDKKGRYIRHERLSGTMTRSYYVGDVKEETIKAAYEKGVLTITFPKERPEEKNKKFIAIE